jgi:hypothetical protein
MTGLDRLHEIAEDVGRTVWLRDLGAALSETADAIDGGTRDPSGYESDALAWVEENGGLDAVRERLMPEGMEWPRYDSGEQVLIGKTMFSERDGKPHKIARIAMMDSTYLLQDMLGDTIYQGVHGIPVKRPAVLAADGEPLEVGQTVWDTNGDELVIGALEDGGHTVTCRYADVGDGIPVHGMWSPSDLTHQRPGLDTDGVPIKKGDTVYLLPGEWCGEYPLRYYRAGDEMVVKELCPDHEYEGVLKCAGDGKCACFPLPCQLTHTKPEPDSWSSVWADVSNGNETPEGMMRRCRALAERGE